MKEQDWKLDCKRISYIEFGVSGPYPAEDFFFREGEDSLIQRFCELYNGSKPVSSDMYDRRSGFLTVSIKLISGGQKKPLDCLLIRFCEGFGPVAEIFSNRCTHEWQSYLGSTHHPEMDDFLRKLLMKHDYPYPIRPTMIMDK